MLMKFCSCGRRLPQGERCIVCARAANRKHDRERRDKERAAFYNSSAWRRMTAAIKARAFGLDEYARAEGRIEVGELVHHIEPPDEAPARSLSTDNLIYVSADRHRRIHAAYARSAESKREMQSRLRAAIRHTPF